MPDNNSYPIQPDRPSFTPNYSTVPLYGQAEREAWMEEGAKLERERAERAEALLHRVANTDITSSEWPTVMHEVRAWEAGDE